MNLYWAIYENLEEETLALADNISFTDEQLDVYSLRIGNLLIRCAVEIETLSKELYLSLGGMSKIFDEKESKYRPPFFDTECLALLVNKWKIDKKKVQISSYKMQFSLENSLLTPLHKSNKRSTSGSKWKRAYQAIKHDRAHSMKEATIKNLLNALGALYILNIYHRNDSFWYDVPIEGREEYRSHSKIFSPFIYEVPGEILASDEHLKNANEIQFDDCIYIKKLTNTAFEKIAGLIYGCNLDITLQTISNEKYVKYKQKHLNENEQIDASFIEKLGLSFTEMIRNIRVNNIPSDVYRSKEIVLNKNQLIYPNCSYKDFLKTETAKKMIDDRINE